MSKILLRVSATGILLFCLSVFATGAWADASFGNLDREIAAAERARERAQNTHSLARAAARAAREKEEAQRAIGNTIVELRYQREAERKAGAGTGSVDYLAEKICICGRLGGNIFDWPLRGPINSPFGQRTHPVLRARVFHSGIDITAPMGTPVAAAAPGEVIFEGCMRGFGRVVIIDHGHNFATVYARLSDTRVREGTIVGAGAIIGAVGNTGTSTGYHLHFEVREGTTARNPINFLRP